MSKVIDQLGSSSKSTQLNLAITASDLFGTTDFSNSINKTNAVYVELINGKYVTKLRTPNNVIIYKKDLMNIPLLLEIINQSDLKGSSVRLDSFSTLIQSKIGLCFMQYYGYVRNIEGDLFFTEDIRNVFDTEWWNSLFDSAFELTKSYIQEEIELGNQPAKNEELIVDSGYISVEKFKVLQPEPNMDILWALVIYFFEKIVRNWSESDLPEIPETDTIMDIDLDPGKYIKLMDAKKFFLSQLQIYLQLKPSDIFFGGTYFSKLKEYLHKKATNINKLIILEELTYFTDWMNVLYSGGNNELNSVYDSGTEPFAVRDVIYSEEENGPTTTIVLNIILQINTYKESALYTLPVSTKINN